MIINLLKWLINLFFKSVFKSVLFNIGAWIAALVFSMLMDHFQNDEKQTQEAMSV